MTKPQPISRRGFFKTAVVGTAALLASCKSHPSHTHEPLPDVGAARGERPVVSIVKIKDGKIAWAVEAAVDLLGGIAGLTQGKERIMLKPNLVSDDPRATANAGSPGIAFEILDIVNANKSGLVVVDGSTAMEGDGPGNGTLIPMDVIIAGTNPLAMDIVAVSVMGFKPDEVPTFVLAKGAGMGPQSLDEIEIRGESVSSVRHRFNRPQLTAWNDIRSSWGVQVIP